MKKPYLYNVYRGTYLGGLVVATVGLALLLI